jgi:hypothetical protein
MRTAASAGGIEAFSASKYVSKALLCTPAAAANSFTSIPLKASSCFKLLRKLTVLHYTNIRNKLLTLAI